MQFRNCTEIRFLFSTLNYIKYLKDKLFWVSILDDASSWNSIRFSQWQNQIVESFFWTALKSKPSALQVTNKRVWKMLNKLCFSPICDKLWILSVWQALTMGGFWCSNPGHWILIDAFSNLIFVIVLTVHFHVTTHCGLGLVSSWPLFAYLQQFWTVCTAFFYWSLHR